jgi:hypothetical protein
MISLTVLRGKDALGARDGDIRIPSLIGDFVHRLAPVVRKTACVHSQQGDKPKLAALGRVYGQDAHAGSADPRTCVGLAGRESESPSGYR